MKIKKRNLLLLASVCAIVYGMIGLIPALSKENYIAASLFALLFVVGLVLLAIAFGEE